MTLGDLMHTPLINDRILIQAFFMNGTGKHKHRVVRSGKWYEDKILELKDMQVDYIAWKEEAVLMHLI